MSKLDIIQLDRELKEKRLRPLYVVVGEEAYLVHGSLKKIEHAVFGDIQNELAKTVMEGQKFNPESFVNAMQSVPMFGGRALVIVRDAEKISKEKLEAILPHLEKLKNLSVAIFIAQKLDGRGRFMQAVLKSTSSVVVECKPLYSNQVPSWISMEVHKLGKKISQEAANYLSDIVGTDLGQLSQAIERLVLFVGARPIIELKDIEESISETTQRSVFELTDAIGLKNLPKALTVLKNLLEYGVQPVVILAMIARHFRILARAKEVNGQLGNASVASYLGVNPYFVKNYMDQSSRFSSVEIRKKFKKLAECDRQLKSSRIPRDRILERLILMD